MAIAPRTVPITGRRRVRAGGGGQRKGRTSRVRGLTSVKELRAGKVNVAAASDNVRDSWYQFGDYDGLGIFLQLGFPAAGLYL